jgi:hypothetical protein
MSHLKNVLARERVRKVANGATINGTYKMMPGEALTAFRHDLLLLVKIAEGAPER